VFDHAELDRHDDGNHVRNPVEGRTADPAQPEDERYSGEQNPDQPGTDDRPEPAATDVSARPEPTSLDEPSDRMPDDAPAAPVAAILPEGSVQDFRDRWREAQLRFVDDPRKVAGDTRSLVHEAVEALTAALASHREQLDALPANGDTEQYRLVVQRYRVFLERLLTW
jgi:hypothetical protein